MIELSNVSQIHIFQIDKADNHIRYLNSSIVDVILDLDTLSGGPQNALKGVAEDRISYMPDMCSLIRINGRVFDATFWAQKLPSLIRRGGRVFCGRGGRSTNARIDRARKRIARSVLGQKLGPIEENI